MSIRMRMCQEVVRYVDIAKLIDSLPTTAATETMC
jgi:hypothetical protein